MKSICMTAVFLVMVLLTACQGLAEKKNVQSNETTSSTLRLSNTDQQKYQETSGETVQGIERWWLKRNENHQTPEVSDYIDLSKYDAYYVNPKCKKKKIFLTFDCGYENGFTPKILDVLKRQKVVAAFFVTLSDRDNKQEIIDCAEYCKEATGYEMDHFIRPPMGEYNEKTLKLTKSMGYKTIFWSMAYVDFDVNKQPGKQYVVEHFKKYTHNGAIPLMHNVSQSNAEALDEVITNLKKEGYQFESLKKLSSY